MDCRSAIAFSIAVMAGVTVGGGLVAAAVAA